MGGAALVFGQLGRDKRDDKRIGPVLLKKTGLGGAEGLLWWRGGFGIQVCRSQPSMHMGRLTKVKTLYSIMMEKQRKTAYRTRT